MLDKIKNFDIRTCPADKAWDIISATKDRADECKPHEELEAEYDALASFLSRLCGEGEPYSQEYAESIGGDYYCALSDGTILANGADISICPGMKSRELIRIYPKDQLLEQN